MRLLRALLVILTAGVLIGLPATSAQAHVPRISADCDGIRLGATHYDPNVNRWSVTIGDETRSGTFRDSLSETFPVPQGGATTSWSAFIVAENGDYPLEESGEVGPCGTPPQAPPDVDRVEPRALEGCVVTLAGTSYGAGELTYDELFTDTYVLEGGEWVLVPDTTPTIANIVFTPWTTAEQVEEGCVEMPAQPNPTTTVETSEECVDDVMVTTTTTTTTPFVHDAASNTWVPGQPVVDTQVTEAPAAEECDEGPGPGPGPVPASVRAAARTTAPTRGSPASARAAVRRRPRLRLPPRPPLRWSRPSSMPGSRVPRRASEPGRSGARGPCSWSPSARCWPPGRWWPAVADPVEDERRRRWPEDGSPAAAVSWAPGARRANRGPGAPRRSTTGELHRVDPDAGTTTTVDLGVPTTLARLGSRLHLPNARSTTPPTATTGYRVTALRTRP